MVTIESKLNYHSLEELELMDADTYTIIIDKISNLDLKSINIVANYIATCDIKQKIKKINPDKSIIWITSKKLWVCSRWLKGKKIYVKASKNKQIVIDANKEFCKKHGIV